VIFCRKISLAHFDRFRAFAADTISYMAMRQARRQSVAGYSCIVKPCPAHGDTLFAVAIIGSIGIEAIAVKNKHIDERIRFD
jgi:hypothetical protein